MVQSPVLQRYPARTRASITQYWQCRVVFYSRKCRLLLELPVSTYFNYSTTTVLYCTTTGQNVGLIAKHMCTTKRRHRYLALHSRDGIIFLSSKFLFRTTQLHYVLFDLDCCLLGNGSGTDRTPEDDRPIRSLEVRT
jgi:hypothetical protein